MVAPASGFTADSSSGAPAFDAIAKLAEALKRVGAVSEDARTNLEKFADTLARPLPQPAGASPTRIAPDASSGGRAFDALGRIAVTLKDVGGVAANTTSGLARFGDAIAGGLRPVGQLVSGLTSLAKGAAAVSGAVTALGYAMGSFVAKANPVVFQQFTLAVDDMRAVIGHALIPVFKLVTETVRAVGDTLATFSNSIGSSLATVLRPVVDGVKVGLDILGRIGQEVAKVFEAVAPAVATLGEVFSKLQAAIAPLINLVVELLGGALATAMEVVAAAVEAVAPVLLALADVVGRVVKFVVEAAKDLLALFGIEIADRPGRKEGASVGAATRQASTTSIESVLQKARESAFSLGGGAKEDPAKRTATATESIRAKFDVLIDVVKQLPEKIAIAMAKGVVATGERVARGIGAAAGDIDETLGLTRGLERLGIKRGPIDEPLRDVPGFDAAVDGLRRAFRLEGSGVVE